MIRSPLKAALARPLAGLIALIAVLVLAGCGGGSGAPNNPYAPVFSPAPLTILPAAPTIYAQVAATLTISGGTAPYRAFSSNSAVLPVTLNLPGNTVSLLAGNVTQLTTITVTIQDAAGATASVDVTVLPGPATPPTPITVLPNPVDVYPQIGTQLTISGGVPPYRAFSSNTAVLPVSQNVIGNVVSLTANPVNADTAVTVTIQDSVNQTAAVNVTVHPKQVASTPLVVLPAAVTTSKAAPATVTISGGLTPYKAYSSNPGLLPVAQNVVGNSITLAPAPGVTIGQNANVAVTVQDSAGQTAVIQVTITPDVSVPAPLAVVPPASTAFSGVPTSLTITGGVPPYTAFSSNAAILPANVAGSTIPLLPANVAAATNVTITVNDSINTSTTATVTVTPAALVNNLTITPNLAECGTQAICSGQTGTASVSVQAPGGGPAPGRQIRFDVVQGPFGIVSGASTLPSVVVTSDAAGNASVIIRANVDAPTQPAQIRVTDIASGQQITGTFIIQQVTNGSTILTVVPPDATITGSGSCSATFRLDYYIYGGTPPYRVTQSIVNGVNLINSVVAQSGGFFEVETNGTCVDPEVFSIVDATGRQVTATLHNVPGTSTGGGGGGGGGGALTITPGDVNVVCSSNQDFVISGGTPPYNVSKQGPVGVTVNPAVVNSSGGTVTIGNITGPTIVHFVDSTSPNSGGPLTATRNITCSP